MEDRHWYLAKGKMVHSNQLPLAFLIGGAQSAHNSTRFTGSHLSALGLRQRRRAAQQHLQRGDRAAQVTSGRSGQLLCIRGQQLPRLLVRNGAQHLCSSCAKCLQLGLTWICVSAMKAPEQGNGFV